MFLVGETLLEGDANRPYFTFATGKQNNCKRFLLLICNDYMQTHKCIDAKSATQSFETCRPKVFYELDSSERFWCQMSIVENIWFEF